MDQTKRPNIKFTGRDKIERRTRKVIKKAIPVPSYIHAGETVALPDPAVQLDERKFYHERAGEIRRLFPHLYKLIKPRKGAK